MRRVARPDVYIPCHFGSQLEVLPSCRVIVTTVADLFDRNVRWIDPAEMAEDEVTKFLTHLARDRHVAPSTQNQARKSLPRPTRLGSRAKAKDYFTCTTFTCCAQ